MHDTAFRIGTLAMNIYADLSTANVLEVGSRAISGSLRDNALPTTNYVGLDQAEGEGVDIVAKPGILPVDDETFDLVIASSVFEHDPAFWITFLEMCRKTKEGGYIYINALSNGAVHGQPQDHWRFHPDSGSALVKWAVSQGQHVSLVESFIADRDGDISNDFVAVFRKGRITHELPKTFIHENIPCSNVMTWKSSTIINRRDVPEDMVLLQGALDRAHAAEQSLDQAIADRDRVREELAASENASRLRQKEEQARTDEVKQQLYDEASRRSRAEASASQLKTQYDRQLSEIAEMRDALVQAKKEQQRRSSDQLAQGEEALRKQLRAASEKLSACEGVRREAQAIAKTREAQIGMRFDEIVTLTSLLRQQEEQSEATQCHLDWFRAVHEALTSQPKWWALMPREWRTIREQRRLKRRGLFDGGAYLQRYPDIAEAGLDPLYHYMTHGRHEGRLKCI